MTSETKCASNRCPVVGGTDFLTNALGRVGINRSFLITLSLIPFAIKGIVTIGSFIGHAYESIAFAVSNFAQ